MCYFITATLASGANLVAVQALEAPEGARWQALSNPYVQTQLPKGRGYYALTGSVCDCHSALVPSGVGLDKRLELPRHAAGWTETKRKRWLEQRGALLERREAAARRDTTAWYDYLKSALRAAGKPPVGLLLHFYSGGVETEEITLARRASVNLRALPPTVLQTLELDVLYEFS